MKFFVTTNSKKGMGVKRFYSLASAKKYKRSLLGKGLNPRIRKLKF